MASVHTTIGRAEDGALFPGGALVWGTRRFLLTGGKGNTTETLTRRGSKGVAH